MTVGVLQLEFLIPGAMSLKDKRRAIRSFKDRVANANNVSVAEVGALDEHRRSIIAIAMVSADRAYVEGGLSRLADQAKIARDLVLQDYSIELI